MKNFFIQHSEVLSLKESHFLYDKGAYIDDSILHDSEITVPLTFEAVLLKNLKHDFLIISADQFIHRINKYRKQIEKVGLVTDTILDVSAKEDAILIVTSKELLLFNGYFDLVRSVAINLAEIYNESFTNIDLNKFSLSDYQRMSAHCKPFRVIWADDFFSLWSKSKCTIFTSELEISSFIQQNTKDMIYISKYNIFACAMGDKIRFFEPNGLEHGSPIPMSCDVIEMLYVDDAELLVLYKEGISYLYYMKNFHWYRKMAVTGQLLTAESNILVFIDGKSLIKHYVYSKIEKNAIIDGASVKYTNYLKSLIPLPYFYKKLSFDSQVSNLCIGNGKLIVLTEDKLYFYKIDEDDNFELVKSIDRLDLLKQYQKNDPTRKLGHIIINDIVLLNSCIIFRICNQLYKINEELSSVQKFDPVSQDNELRQKNIINIYSVRNNLGILFTDGTFYYQNTLKFNLNLEKSYNLQSMICEMNTLDRIDNLSITTDNQQPTFYLLSDKSLQYYKDGTLIIIPDVSAFIIYKTYLIYTMKNELIIFENGQAMNSSYADDGLIPLTVAKNKIVCYTRFGSLETTTNKVFSRILILDLMNQGKYKEAAERCDRDHVAYNIFYKNGRCPASVISHLENSQILSLVTALKFNAPVLHENDHVERIFRSFDNGKIYNNRFEKDKLPLERLNNINDDDSYIKEEMSAHLFETAYSGLLNLKKTPCAYDDELDLCNPIPSLNIALKRLDTKKNLNVIVNLLVYIDRVDLCFYLPNLSKVITILMNQISTRDILNSAIKTLSLEKAIQAFKTCQSDYSTFSAFYKSRKNLAFSIYNYVEDRGMALYHLVSDWETGRFVEGGDTGMIMEYALKHDLIDRLLMLQYYGLCKTNFYCIVAETASPVDAFTLYIRGGDKPAALEVAKNNLLWREALEIFNSQEIIAEFITLLLAKKRFVEAGEITEKFSTNFEQAIKYYLLGFGFRQALGLFNSCRAAKDNEGWMIEIKDSFEQAISESIRNLLVELKGTLVHFKKYKERLAKVRERLEENISASQTTFSYTVTSTKSAKNALTKDRPGGVYENEFVLNKIADIVGTMLSLKVQAKAVLVACETFELNNYAEACKTALENFDFDLGTEVDKMWNYERADYDSRRPVVLKPCLEGWYEN